MSSARNVGTTGCAAIVLALAGCGSERQAATPTPPPRCGPLPGASTSSSTSRSTAEVSYLTSVKLDTDRCADRVTFAFTSDRLGTRPGFRVGYASPDQAAIEDGSGRHVSIAGRAFLVVHLEPAATAQIAGEQLHFTYSGPRRLDGASTGHVREVVKTGDFEAVVTWVIGLDERRPYRIVRTATPAGLTVEVG